MTDDYPPFRLDMGPHEPAQPNAGRGSAEAPD